MADLWNCENECSTYVDVPSWIEQDISVQDVAAIIQGGCDSGAYIPAVSYWQAIETMGKDGDDVLQFIQDIHGELPKPDNDESWGGIAVFYLKTAVQIWACGIEPDLIAAIDDEDDDDDDGGGDYIGEPDMGDIDYQEGS